MKKHIRLLLILLCGAVFLFSGWKLLGILRTYQEGSQVYEDLSQYVSLAEPTPTTVPAVTAPPSTDPAPTISTEPTEAPDLTAWPQVDFDALSAINPDVIGWIYIEGTRISYPIVQSEDNDYYLDHLFDGTQNRSGCIFLDYRCSSDLGDRHSIIYGHHLKDMSMFSNLTRYKYQEYYDQHPVALLVTPDAYYKIHLFSGYVVNNRANAWILGLDQEEHTQWLEDICQKSRFKSQFTPSPEDTIITFSTCSYEFDNAKFVLHGYVAEMIENLP